jgi:hypothetical protein
MASAQSSQDMWQGRGHQPQISGNAQPRNRSESRRLSDGRRTVKAAARKCDRCPGALCEGDAIRVFSRSADKWVDGEVVKFMEGNFMSVEYEVGADWCGKTIYLHSEHLEIPLATSLLSEAPSNYPAGIQSEIRSPMCQDEGQHDHAASSPDFLVPSCPIVEPASGPRLPGGSSLAYMMLIAIRSCDLYLRSSRSLARR